MFGRLIEKLCTYIAGLRPRKDLFRPDGELYLSRYYLFGASRKDTLESDGQAGLPNLRRLPKWFKFNVFLHCFHSGDEEIELHSHPWDDSFSIILTGGYREERRVGNKVVVRTLRPGMSNRIKSDDYHRVDLLEGKCWTLFFAGKNASTWYFWDRFTGERIPWREQVFVRRPKNYQMRA